MSSSVHAQLSSLTASIEDLVVRIAEIGEALDNGNTADSANALFEGERSLQMARRAIERARSALPG